MPKNKKATVDLSIIKELRERTGVSLAVCREVLTEAGGQIDGALEILKSRGASLAEKKAERRLGAGTIASYIHGAGAIGALVELRSETDFVAKHEDFLELASDLAMQVAALAPANTEELMNQPFIKNPNETVADLINRLTQKFGERISLGQITRLAADGR